MARPLRLSFPDAAYHVIARGNRKDLIFLDDYDQKGFLKRLDETCVKYSLRCFAYCLMSNHYHLFIQTPMSNISESIHYLNSSYTNWFKTNHNLTGVLFQGRYKSILVDENKYSLYLSAYIHTNPYRAGIVHDLSEYPWSSYQDYIHNVTTLESLDKSFILKQFDANNDIARKKYSNYLNSNLGISITGDMIYKGIAMGNEQYFQSVQNKVVDLTEDREIPVTREIASDGPEEIIQRIMDEFGIPREEIFRKRNGNYYRQMTMYLLKQHTSLSLKEIGAMFGMDYAAVSQACKRYREKLQQSS